MERERPKPQEFYRHFQNKLYQIITVAKHSKTGEELVVYQELYGNYGVYAEPLSMFLSEVDHREYPNVAQKYQFERVFLKEQENQKKEKPKKEALKKEPLKKENPEKGTDSARNISQPAKEKAEEELPNPDLLEFLDARTMKQKKRILIGMRDRITDRLIDDIAASMDVTIGKGEVGERYKSLMVCVDTLERFEVNRLR